MHSDWYIISGEKLLDFVYQDVEKILQLPDVTLVTAEYVELDNQLFSNIFDK